MPRVLSAIEWRARQEHDQPSRLALSDLCSRTDGSLDSDNLGFKLYLCCRIKLVNKYNIQQYLVHKHVISRGLLLKQVKLQTKVTTGGTPSKAKIAAERALSHMDCIAKIRILTHA